MAFTSNFAHHTSYEVIGGGDDEKAWWNETGAVWVVFVVTEDLVIQDLGLFDTRTPYESALSQMYSLDSKSIAFTIPVPLQGCISTYVFVILTQSTPISNAATTEWGHFLSTGMPVLVTNISGSGDEGSSYLNGCTY